MIIITLGSIEDPHPMGCRHGEAVETGLPEIVQEGGISLQPYEKILEVCGCRRAGAGC